jgi:hypothetical protein
MSVGSVSLVGKDTVIIKNRIFKDFGNGDTINIDFPNNLVEAKIGKNGNRIFAYNSNGEVVTVTIKLLRGSADDKFLNTEITTFKGNPPSYILMTGEFIKNIGDGAGNISGDTYTFDGGIVQKYPSVKENTEGDTEQALSIYQLIFTNTSRSI